MTYLIAALLGVVQGVTEFLPVSSTAHLLVVGQWFGYDDPGGAFTVMIQLGSVLAIVWLYRARLAALLLDLPSDPEARRLAGALLVAVVPALAAGALLAEYVQTVLYDSARVIAAALIVGGGAMLLVERYRPEPRVHAAEQTPIIRALGIGMFQVLAFVPGVSRSGATMVAGMLMRLERPAAAEFSFLLAIPTMVSAFVYELVQMQGAVGNGRTAEIAIGFVMAFVSSALVVKPFLAFVRRSGFSSFAWYRIAVGAGLMAMLRGS